MRIQHNIMAMNSYRNYNNNTSALSSNLEKLSSGYRINRAGDDAAGLAISEKMRAQITGLDAAQKNVQDGISLVKTAEGALQEVQDMLNRMVYLAEQSANGTYDNDVDRKALQEEVNALMTEIDRIAESSNFNGTKLLDGSLNGVKVTATNGTAGTAGNTTTSYTVEAADQAPLCGITYVSGLTGASGAANATVTVVANSTNFDISVTHAGKTYTATNVATSAGEIELAASDSSKIKVNVGTAAVGAGQTLTKQTESTQTGPTTGGTKAKTEIDFTGMSANNVLGGTVKIGTNTYEFVTDAANVTGTNKAVVIAADADAAAIAGKLEDVITAASDTALNSYTVTESAGKVTIEQTNITTSAVNAVAVEQNGLGGLNLQIGDTSDSFNQLNVKIESMKFNDIMGAALDIDDQASAKTAIDAIKVGINKVSEQRGKLGAIQNRLEHTAKNLSVMEENIQNAESAIRDTDIADEMTAYTKNNILLQSAQAMLAQANQVPQGVLQLLQ